LILLSSYNKELIFTAYLIDVQHKKEGVNIKPVISLDGKLN